MAVIYVEYYLHFFPLLVCCIADPFYFYTDPDPRIHFEIRYPVPTLDSRRYQNYNTQKMINFAIYELMIYMR